MNKKIAPFCFCILIAILVIPSVILAQSSNIKEYKVTYLDNGKIKLSYGKLSKIFNLTDHISGCLGNLYDPSSNETIKSSPSVDIVLMSKKSKITTLLLFVTTSPNCNIQGQCGAGTNADLIALSITDKLNRIYINSFSLDNCYSGRSSKYAEDEEFYDNYGVNMSAIIRNMKSKIKIEFNESNVSNMVMFDMKEPSKGFIVETTLPK